MSRIDELRSRALKKLKESGVLMSNGHFDYHNGFHGRVYLNPHQLFRYPSTIWQLAQDLLETLPAALLEQTEIVAGPATGGALLAHTIAGLLDGRRALTHPPCSFAPFTPGEGKFVLRDFYAKLIRGRTVMLRGSTARMIDLPDNGRISSVVVSYVNRGARGASIKLVAKANHTRPLPPRRGGGNGFGFGPR